NGTYIQCGLLHWCTKNHWKDGIKGTSVNLKLPDVQDATVTLRNVVAGLLNPTGSSPKFPNGADGQPKLFAYTFRQSTEEIKSVHTVSNCASIGPSFNWVSGNCLIDQDVGTPAAPVIIITSGNLVLKPGVTV